MPKKPITPIEGVDAKSRSETNRSDQHGLKNSVSAVKDLTLSILRDPRNPGWLKGLCWAGAIGQIGALLLGVSLIGSNHPELGFWLEVIVFVFLAFVVIILYQITMRGVGAVEGSPEKAQPRQPAPVEPMWSRVVPKLPIPLEVLDAIRGRLEEIRGIAFVHLNEKFPNTIKRECIRANIFLVDTGAVITEGICELYIPKRLHVGMEPTADRDKAQAELERNIRFKPGQGATGVAFLESQIQMARAIKIGEKESSWDEKYALTESQKRAIHSNLKWVISFPLSYQDGKAPRALGVLNIDGLSHELDDECLNSLAGKLFLNVIAVSGLIYEKPKCKMSLTVEEIYAHA